MALVLDATVGGPSANAYCTQAEATTYHESHPYASAWTAATDDTKNRAIATATRLLDEHMAWMGVGMTETQALGWPRTGGVYRNGWTIPTTVVPAEVKRATAELARQMLATDRTADSDVQAQGLTSLTAGSVSMQFDGHASQASVLPDAVVAMIRHLGTVVSRRRVVVPLIRA